MTVRHTRHIVLAVLATVVLGASACGKTLREVGNSALDYELPSASWFGTVIEFFGGVVIIVCLLGAIFVAVFSWMENRK